ncbi:MAG: YifB family Mg chelatase-like AAA ATPase [Gammaproteobacteria bacterium]
MTLATALSRAQQGIDAPLVNVEVHLSNGLPRMSIVGLPETAVKESKDRVRAALLNSNFRFPRRIITVSLAPADLPKDGGRFDLSIALGILAASGQIPKDALAEHEFIGELALSGELRPVRGVLPAALKASAESRSLVVPRENSAEGALAKGVKVLPADHLLQVCAHLAGSAAIEPYGPGRRVSRPHDTPDMADVRGQHRAKRALEIAATGGHNMLMIGPPGTGKTMLASRLPTILPPMTEAESLEAAAISSISSQGFHAQAWGRRPFRAPHHTASGVALVGGGSSPRPGEISLAHNGVLFLDELTEFDRRVLEVLREPLETGRITISRAARQAEFPAQFQLIAAMNPCPQGYDCDLRANCRCTPEQQRKYRSRVSAPLLDRIDLHVDAPRVPREMLRSETAGESSAVVRARVIESRDRQLRRQNKFNALMSNRDVEQHCRLDEQTSAVFDQAINRFRLSARAYHRILKVARTIADIAANERIDQHHLTESVSYRSLDWFHNHGGRSA